MKNAIFLFSIFAFGACASETNNKSVALSDDSTTPTFAAGEATTHAEAEVLGFMTDHLGITFQVPTGGCTEKEHLSVEKSGSNPVALKLIRHRADTCEAFLPFGVQIKFTYAEMGIQGLTHIVVANTPQPQLVSPPR